MNVASGWRFLPVSVAVIGVDQFTKLLVVQHFKTYGVVHVLPVLDITLRYNTGAAFSFLAGASGWQRWLFIILALAVSGVILIWMRRLKSGNVIDRLRLGHVIDFVVVHWHHSQFPAFNVADSSITIGAALLLLDAWLESRRAKGDL